MRSPLIWKTKQNKTKNIEIFCLSIVKWVSVTERPSKKYMFTSFILGLFIIQLKSSRWGKYYLKLFLMCYKYVQQNTFIIENLSTQNSIDRKLISAIRRKLWCNWLKIVCGGHSENTSCERKMNTSKTKTVIMKHNKPALDIYSYMGRNNHVIMGVQEVIEYHGSLLVRGKWSILLWIGLKQK